MSSRSSGSPSADFSSLLFFTFKKSDCKHLLDFNPRCHCLFLWQIPQTKVFVDETLKEVKGPSLSRTTDYTQIIFITAYFQRFSLLINS